jgi:hypothetical protein
MQLKKLEREYPVPKAQDEEEEKQKMWKKLHSTMESRARISGWDAYNEVNKARLGSKLPH